MGVRVSRRQRDRARCMGLAKLWRKCGTLYRPDPRDLTSPDDHGEPIDDGWRESDGGGYVQQESDR